MIGQTLVTKGTYITKPAHSTSLPAFRVPFAYLNHWHPPAPELRELQALVRRLDSLVEMRTMEENRLSSGIVVEAVRASVEELIAHLSGQIKRT
jgi:transposase